MDLQIRDRVVLVTGGTSGIGLALVARLLGEGAVVVTCGRDRDRAAAALGPLLEQHAERLTFEACDVRDRDQVDQLVAGTVGGLGRLDGLVNNAGQSRISTFETTTDEAWRDELDLKFGSIVNTVRACRPHLRATDEASIVNVNSILARQPEPHLVATSAARAGVLNLTRSLASELAGDGIRVNSVNLGLIDTGQWQRRYEAADTDQSYEDWSAVLAADRGIQLGRFGHADEVADMIAVLLSPVASYVTGASLDVGGGVNRYV
jgi:NAD(P)-dependent dehydrogenase (short-subunit alcohol dehydrogenase family)